MGLKQLGQAVRVVQRVVCGVEQRQIALLGTTVPLVSVEPEKAQLLVSSDLPLGHR
jgi:chorismate-pyruvate lyase